MKNERGNFKRHICSVVIAIAMCSVLLPFGKVSAAGPEAMIGTTSYTTLKAAVDAAYSGAVIKVMANVDATSDKIEFTKDATLDLNGYSVQTTNGINQIVISNSAEVTLKDSSSSKAGKIFSTTPYVENVCSSGVIRVSGEYSHFIMDSGNIEAVIADDPVHNGQFGVVAWEGGDVTINGGTIKAGWYAISGNGTHTTQYSQIDVNGGTLISTADYAIYQPQTGKATIAGGVIYGATGGISINNGALKVTGGTITSKGQGTTGTWGDGTGGQGNAAINVNAKYGVVNTKITGGTIIAEGDAITIAQGSKYTPTITITGGYFSSDPDISGATSVVVLKKMESTSISAIPTQTETGKAITPAVVVKDGSTTLKANTDYTVAYTNNVKPGTATVTVTGKGAYIGTKTATFVIKAKPAVTPKPTVAPKAPVIKKVKIVSVKKSSKKKLKVTWKKAASINGYQVQYSLKKSMKSAKIKKITKAKTTKVTLKKLKSRKKYYVRVRAYKVVNGKTYYGAWSSKKSCKTK